MYGQDCCRLQSSTSAPVRTIRLNRQAYVQQVRQCTIRTVTFSQMDATCVKVAKVGGRWIVLTPTYPTYSQLDGLPMLTYADVSRMSAFWIPSLR